ncbi:hypothetical protein QTP88_001042 [Uroleucon formosanum]
MFMIIIYTIQPLQHRITRSCKWLQTFSACAMLKTYSSRANLKHPTKCFLFYQCCNMLSTCWKQ